MQGVTVSMVRRAILATLAPPDHEAPQEILVQLERLEQQAIQARKDLQEFKAQRAIRVQQAPKARRGQKGMRARKA
jgi:hypothetical protein